jgi:nitroreductase
MSFLVDVSIAFTHLILAARAEGLGTCWIGSFDNDRIKELLSIPDDYDVVAVSPLGYPDNEWFKETDRRKPLSEITSLNRF